MRAGSVAGLLHQLLLLILIAGTCYNNGVSTSFLNVKGVRLFNLWGMTVNVFMWAHADFLKGLEGE